VLSTKYLVDQTDIPISLAEEILLRCEENAIASLDGAVDLSMTEQDIAQVLDVRTSGANQELYSERKEAILKVILRSRYANLFSLLQTHVAEETYLGIVQNKILVDVQGEDVSWTDLPVRA
jgi:cell division ATPase FtsA